jgi:hypothetical protein
MSATNGFENKILILYFQNGNAADIGDVTGLRGSTTAGSLFVALTTADPGEAASSQLTSESAYTNYARQAVARSAGGWAVASGNADNVAAITFPTCGVTGSTITNFTLGSATSGAGTLDIIGTASLIVNNGITPSFAIGACDNSLD